ncbi:hypothetical protein V8G54_008513 [Vigna mungo]|uniref:Uncharacterized protein n=1 Tax=Vigna mungo TaxID=3915 RepID=A0AAQ3P3B9_VIGMU
MKKKRDEVFGGVKVKVEISEFLFRFVENEDFRDFVWSLQPQFEVPSRTMVRREILELYGEEKTKFEFFLSKECERASLKYKYTFVLLDMQDKRFGLEVAKLTVVWH